MKLILTVTLVALAAGAATCQVNQQAIDDVAAGKIKEANASWWGFNAEDSTDALQAAINSGVPKLIVENMGAPWIVRPLMLASDQEIMFEEGVELVAKKGEFKGGGDSLLSAAGKQNITLTGYGATLRMQRADYDNPELYKKAEWRHCLSFKSCTNINIFGLTLTESGGDGIYLGSATAGVTNLNIHIKDVVCEANYRQGISVITAENLLIENTVMSNTAGTPPQAGIDFEPNNPGERVVNAVMRDCVSEGNVGCGYVAYLRPMDATSEPVSLKLENCRASNNRGPSFSIAIGNAPDKAVDGLIELVNCVLEGSANAGLVIRDKPADRCQMRLESCSILDNAADASLLAPILFMSSQDAEEPIGGVQFASCRVRDEVERNPMGYIDSAGGLALEDVAGTLILERGGQEQSVTLTPELLAEWMPALAMKRISRLSIEGTSFGPLVAERPPGDYTLVPARVRGDAHLLLYATEGDPVSFTVRYGQVGRYAGEPMPVVVTAPSGAEAASVPAAFQEDTEVAFTAPETGTYRVEADASPNTLQVIASCNRINLDGSSGPNHLMRAAGDFPFWVPAGTTEFGVRLAGEGAGEATAAALLNPAGEVVD
ncbi:MAG TPA: right-handed parallel beta-helix repeat-containing protein, partial [Armatimonadota bacterium]|nr:right-handed parallel beta-helix repeat-containing protein [Armatimonadota bacterium]